MTVICMLRQVFDALGGTGRVAQAETFYAANHIKILRTVIPDFWQRAKISQELCKLYDWLTANKLTLNIKKSNFVIFSPVQRKSTYQPKIMIFDNEQNKNVALECKEFIKYLGILIDSHLTWKHHIDHIAIKISRTIGLISKIRHFVPKHTLINIYRSLVAPYLSYGLIVWGQACKSYLDKLLKLQKRALRFIYFLTAISMQFLYFPMPVFYRYNFLIMNLQLT